MNRRNRNKTLFVFCALLVSTPCFCVKNIFNKIGNTAKSAVATVTHAGAEVTGKISQGLDKAAHKMGAKDHDCNKGQIPEAPSTQPPVVLPEKPLPTEPDTDQTSKPKTVIPDEITRIIEILGNAPLCGKEMLTLCSIICDDAYKGYVEKNETSVKLGKKIAKEAIKKTLEAKQRQYEFRAVLLCLALDTYFVDLAYKIWTTNGLQKKLERYADEYQIKTIAKIVRYFHESSNESGVNPQRTIEVANHWIDYTIAAKMLSEADGKKLKK